MLQSGAVIILDFTENRELHLIVNDVNLGCFSRMTQKINKLYPIIDIYGQCEQVMDNDMNIFISPSCIWHILLSSSNKRLLDLPASCWMQLEYFLCRFYNSALLIHMYVFVTLLRVHLFCVL